MKMSRRFLVPMFTKPKTNAVAFKALSYGPLNKEQAESCLCPLVQSVHEALQSLHDVHVHYAHLDVRLFTFLSPYINASRCLSKDDEYFLALVKLRLNFLFQDLAYRFGISVSSISTIFKMLDIMFCSVAVFDFMTY